MTYNCPQCGLPRKGNQAVGLAMPQCLCSWQFTPPPQRKPWLNLTDEERSEIGQEAIKFDWLVDYAEAIDFVIDKTEQKLKEKNA